VKRRSTSVVMCAIFVALAGCGGPPAPEGPSNSAASASATAAIDPAGGTLQFPMAAGYGGSFVYSANDASGVVTVALTTTTAPVAGLAGPAPAGTTLVSFEFTLSKSVTFAKWYRLLTTITIPASIPTAGHTFAEYGYDLTTGNGTGSNPGVVNGTTITFSPGLGPVTLLDHRFVMTLVMN
jgi:hypothetical protein